MYRSHKRSHPTQQILQEHNLCFCSVFETGALRPRPGETGGRRGGVTNHTHHPLHHLQQLPAGLLHALGVSLDADQPAVLTVLRDSHRHLVLLLDPVDCGGEGGGGKGAAAFRHGAGGAWRGAAML